MQRTGTQPIILIVEDYADSRFMLKLLLEDAGYSVLTAANGNEALTTAAGNHIDLVLTDFNLPDLTGPTVLRRLRQLNGQLKRVPAIVLTAFDGQEYRDLAAKAGCDAFVVKPLDFDTLKGIIDRLLRGSRDKAAFESREAVTTRQRFQGNSVQGNTNVKVEPWRSSLST